MKVIIDDKYSSTTCPKCGSKLKRMVITLRCEKCGFEENRDYIAVYNLYGMEISNPLDYPSNERCRLESVRGTPA
ncbi:transposase [Acidianus sulfidivorans]|nr:transposase [Acidianus sulfidivorans]